MENIWNQIPLFCSNNNDAFTKALSVLEEIADNSLKLSYSGANRQSKAYYVEEFSKQFPPRESDETIIEYDLILDGPLTNEFEYLFEKLIGILREIHQEKYGYDYDFDRADFRDRLENALDQIADIRAIP